MIVYFWVFALFQDTPSVSTYYWVYDNYIWRSYKIGIIKNLTFCWFANLGIIFLVKLATQFILANNYNTLDKVVQWSKRLGKIHNNKCKCLLILQFSAVPSQINLHLIHILQNIFMEDLNFHQHHLLLFVAIKRVKENNKSTDFEC